MKWLLFFLTLNVAAQPDRFWHSGGNYRLDFSTNPPTVLTGGCINTTEGTASISDAAGNFLFSTDGVTVYDRNCAVMTNGTGLAGGSSSTQSSIVVQKPGSTNLYYIFTASQDINPPGISYSEVNMSLSGGLGAVTTKNVSLTAFLMCEKLTAVRHCNNVDVWVIAKRWNSSAFLAWRITSTGVIIPAVVSSAGVVPTGASPSSYGQLKSNVQGNKLIAAYYGTTGGGMNTAEIYNFDNSTGIVSSAVNLGTIVGAYGCEFSPNGNVAYVATNQGSLFSFNLCTNNIAASRVQIASTGPFFGSMQLERYGRILIAKGTLSRLAAIQSPNTFGAGCNFTDNFLVLPASSRMGLPNFVPYYFQQTIDFTWNETCGLANFQVSNPVPQCGSPPGPIGYSWNFGDGTFSSVQNPSHLYFTPGNYTVTLTTQFPCYNTTRTENIVITGNSATLFPISHD
jgi:hypothetical protein